MIFFFKKKNRENMEQIYAIRNGRKTDTDTNGYKKSATTHLAYPCKMWWKFATLPCYVGK